MSDYSPQMIEKLASKGLPLATAPVLGQPPRYLPQRAKQSGYSVYYRRDPEPLRRCPVEVNAPDRFRQLAVAGLSPSFNK